MTENYQVSSEVSSREDGDGIDVLLARQDMEIAENELELDEIMNKVKGVSDKFLASLHERTETIYNREMAMKRIEPELAGKLTRNIVLLNRKTEEMTRHTEKFTQDLDRRVREQKRRISELKKKMVGRELEEHNHRKKSREENRRRLREHESEQAARRGAVAGGTGTGEEVAWTGEETGYTVTEPDQPGYAVTESGQPGYTVTEPDQPGYAVTESGQPGYAVTESDQPGYAVTESDQPGHTMSESGQPGYAVTESDHPGYITSGHARPMYAGHTAPVYPAPGYAEPGERRKRQKPGGKPEKSRSGETAPARMTKPGSREIGYAGGRGGGRNDYFIVNYDVDLDMFRSRVPLYCGECGNKYDKVIKFSSHAVPRYVNVKCPECHSKYRIKMKKFWKRADISNLQEDVGNWLISRISE